MGMLKSYANSDTNVENKRNAAQIEQLLDAEASRQPSRNWPRLDNTERVSLLRAFATAYCEEEGCTKRVDELATFLLVALTRKRLSRVKDVEYDKVNECIVRIHGLSLDGNNQFVLQRVKPTVRPQN